MNEFKAMEARANLESLADKPANTSEARFRVLAAIDSYVRLTTERTTDIRKARNIVGTCPDMCPEKERYLREWKNMVPAYERHPASNRMDHAKAIKQYSRSSADQELPLPHELRTKHALGSTMYFLLANHADRIDDPNELQGAGNVSDWFHYIWDRTRGIRKDITQQDLCSPMVVELVQQCARFHIHCAARHVNEDPSVFDQRINTENLTKCLQTLKYMYADLKQQGIQCTDEGEFRAYMMLLYLNEGSFQTELRGLSAAIIHSSEVQFALSVHRALVHNDYVRFFEMVRQASYMNACILLRYFTQMRLTALKVIRKAYVVRSAASFELSYLVKILGFDDETEAEGFFEHFGVNVDRDNGRVTFEARRAVHNDQPYVAQRSLQLVESKRNCSVGDAICGAPLHQWGAQFPPVPCVTSFDEHGFLREQVLEGVFGPRGKQIEQGEQLDSEEQLIQEVFGRDMEIEELPIDEPINIDDLLAIDDQLLEEQLGSGEMGISQEGHLTSNGQQEHLQELRGELWNSHSAEVDKDTINWPQSSGSVSRSIHPPMQTDTYQWPAVASSSDVANTLNIQEPVTLATNVSTPFAAESIQPVGMFISAPNAEAAPALSATIPRQISLPGSEQFSSALGSPLFAPSFNHDNTPSHSDSAITMAYVSPPTDTQIAPAGKKRTFFGAVKAPASLPSTVPLGATSQVTPLASPLASPVASPFASPLGSPLPLPLDSHTARIDQPNPAKRPRQLAEDKRKNSIGEASPSATLQQWGAQFPPVPCVNSVNKQHSPRRELLAEAFGSRGTQMERDEQPSLFGSPGVTASSVVDSSAAFGRDDPHDISGPIAQQEQQHPITVPARAELRDGASSIPASSTTVSENAEPEAADDQHDAEPQTAKIYERVLSDEPDEIIAEQDSLPESALVEQFQAKRTDRLMMKYFSMWLDYARTKIDRRRMVRRIPPQALPMQVPSTQLAPTDRISSFLKGRRHLDRCRQSVSEQVMDPAFRRHLLPSEKRPASELIDPFAVLHNIAWDTFRNDLQTLRSVHPLYWKLVISVPSQLDGSSSRHSQGFSCFIERCLAQCSFARKPLQQQTDNVRFFLEASENNLFASDGGQYASICMRLVRGAQPPLDETGQAPSGACARSNGMLFFFDVDTPFSLVRERLETVLSICDPCPPAIACLCYTARDVVPASTRAAELKAALSFLNEHNVSSYRVFMWSDPSRTTALRCAMTYLAKAHCKQLRQVSATGKCLEMFATSDFLQRCLGAELWFRWEQASRVLGDLVCPPLAELASDGNAIVQLYQQALRRVLALVDKCRLLEYIRVPEDFDSVRPLWRKSLPTMRTRPQLPEAYFPPNWQHGDNKTYELIENLTLLEIPPELLEVIDGVAQQAAKHGLGIVTTELTDELRNYIANYSHHLTTTQQCQLVEHLRLGIVTQLAGSSYSSLTRPLGDCSPKRRKVYWFPLLSSITESLLSALFAKGMLPPVVYCIRDEFDKFTTEAWWERFVLAKLRVCRTEGI